MRHSKEQLKTGKSGRNCQELEVIHVLLSRLLEEDLMNFHFGENHFHLVLNSCTSIMY